MSVVITLIIAGIGGGFFYLLDVPLAWMLGSYAATACGQFIWQKYSVEKQAYLAMPAQIRHISFPLIGIAIGLRFESGFIENLSLWGGSLSVLLLQTGLMLFVCYFCLTRFLNFPKITAFLSAIPGGMTEIILVAQTYKLDQQTIAIMQILRIIVTVSLLPFLIVAFAVAPRAIALSAGDTLPVFLTFGDFHLDALSWQWAGLIMAAWIIAYLCRVMTIPAAHLLGPILLGMAVAGYGAEITLPPNWMTPLAQIVIGATIGIRFAALPLWSLGKLVITAVSMTLLMGGIAAGFALIVAWYFQIDFFPLFLAYVPGGMTEISVVSLTLELDAPFITSHHIFRVIFLLIGINLFFRFYGAKAIRNGPETIQTETRPPN